MTVPRPGASGGTAAGATTPCPAGPAGPRKRADARRNRARLLEAARAVYREAVDALVARADELEDGTPPWEALTRWLEAFVAYAAAKRTFLTELHEAFGKIPDLAVSSRERIGAATGRLLARAQEAGVVRPDIDQRALMQLVGGMCMSQGSTLEGNLGLLTFVLDGIRAR